MPRRLSSGTLCGPTSAKMAGYFHCPGRIPRRQSSRRQKLGPSKGRFAARWAPYLPNSVSAPPEVPRPVNCSFATYFLAICRAMVRAIPRASPMEAGICSKSAPEIRLNRRLVAGAEHNQSPSEPSLPCAWPTLLWVPPAYPFERACRLVQSTRGERNYFVP